jgi:hypothetical protein
MNHFALFSSKTSLNATTLNLAEKRTAETRSKLEPLNDQEVETSRTRGGVDALEAGDVDPGKNNSNLFDDFKCHCSLAWFGKQIDCKCSVLHSKLVLHVPKWEGHTF